MRVDLHTVQVAAMVLVFALLFVARLVKGTARETPEGLAFPLKSLVIFSRAVALPLYFLLFAYPLWISQQSIPAWLLVLLLIAVLFAAYQLPGTIILNDTSVMQRFWLRMSKTIPYSAIQAIQASRTGVVTRVLGPNNLLIVHTFNHADSDRFRTELAGRSGKRIDA